MSRNRCIPFVFAFLGLLAAALGQQGPAGDGRLPAAEVKAPKGKVASGKDGFVVPMGEVAVDELIDEAARFLGRNLLWHPHEVAKVAPFVFQKPLALDAVGCEELLYGLLLSRGLVIVAVDERLQVHEVVFVGMPAQQNRPDLCARALVRTPEKVLERPQLKQLVSTTVRLAHVNAQHAAQAVRQFVAFNLPPPLGLHVATTPANDAVLLVGLGDQVAAAIRLLRETDVPLKERNPEVWQWSQTIANLQSTVNDLNNRLAVAQQQIAELQKERVPPPKSGGD